MSVRRRSRQSAPGAGLAAEVGEGGRKLAALIRHICHNVAEAAVEDGVVKNAPPFVGDQQSREKQDGDDEGNIAADAGSL